MTTSNAKAGITIFLNSDTVDVKIRHEDGGEQETVAKVPFGSMKDFSHDRKKHSLVPTDLGNNKRGFIFKQGRRYPAIKVWPQSKGHFFGSFDQGDSAPGSYDDMLAAIEGAKQI
jgi:hypothetical protein